MAGTLEEYRDILMADTFVDLPRLKLRAQQGVPSEIRGEVWKYLLGVSKPDKSEEVPPSKSLCDFKAIESHINDVNIAHLWKEESIARFMYINLKFVECKTMPIILSHISACVYVSVIPGGRVALTWR
jgi:hypothetical protein